MVEVVIRIWLSAVDIIAATAPAISMPAIQAGNSIEASSGRIRSGLMMALDLDRYSYDKESDSLIRASPGPRKHMRGSSV